MDSYALESERAVPVTEALASWVGRAVGHRLSNRRFPITARPTQEFGDNPVEVRETGHYTEEYVPSFVEKWDSLIDWEKRAESEGNFFIDLLRKRGVKSVLDVATGTGFHSVRLLDGRFRYRQRGRQRRHAFEGIRERNGEREITSCAWCRRTGAG